MRMTRVLVTGGAGFIGSNLVRFLLRERPGVKVINLDKLTYSGNLESLTDVADDPRYTFIRGDVADEATAAQAVEGCDAVLHLAAESHVDRSITGPRPFVVTNTLGTQTLLDAWRRGPGDPKGGARPFVYVSTDEVYGSLPLDRPELRFTEESPLRPSSVYSASKAAGDLLARAYHTTYGVDVRVTRCSNNFGPCQFPEKIIPLFISQLMDGRNATLYGDGLHVRDWIHVDDHNEGLLAVLDRGEPGRIYNIGASNERSNIELARMILAELGLPKSRLEHVADRPGHDRRYAIDPSRAERELGWRASRSDWPEALVRTIAWYRDNESWWRRVLSGEYLKGR